MAYNPVTGEKIADVASIDIAPIKKAYLRPIPADPILLLKVWNIIKPYVEELATASQGAYEAAYVYYELCHQLAQLTLVFADDKEEKLAGYFIVKRLPNSIHIWQAYALPEFRNTSIVDEAYQEIEKEARTVGYAYITFSSTRTSWHAAADKFGFKEGMCEYRRKL